MLALSPAWVDRSDTDDGSENPARRHHFKSCKYCILYTHIVGKKDDEVRRKCSTEDTRKTDESNHLRNVPTVSKEFLNVEVGSVCQDRLAYERVERHQGGCFDLICLLWMLACEVC